MYRKGTTEISALHQRQVTESLLEPMQKMPFENITVTESYNHCFGWYGGKMEANGPWLDKFHAMHPTIPLGVSEYGCEGIITCHGPDDLVD